MGYGIWDMGYRLQVIGYRLQVIGQCLEFRVSRFQFKILLKILIHKQKRAESPMVSLAQGNTLRKSAFWSKIIVKDYISQEFHFLRSNILIKIFPQDLPVVCFVVTQHSESELSLCLRYSKTSCRRQLIIHGPHGEHRFCLKILLKILVKISSINDAIPNKSLPKSEELERILVEIRFKDFCYHPTYTRI